MNEALNPAPPWEQVPDLPPGDIGWRMGVGEDVMRRWWEWARTVPPAKRRAYLIRHCPIPKGWMLCAAEIYAWPDDDDDALDDAWGALEAAESK